MAMVIKSMEDIEREVTPEIIKETCSRLDNYENEYDPENPPMTQEELEELHKIAEQRRKARQKLLLSA